MPSLSKDQVKSIIRGKPQDVSSEAIIQGLLERGYQLEGLEMSEEKTGVLQTAKELGTGFLKGAGRSLYNLGQTGQMLATPASRFREKFASKITGTPEKEIQPIFKSQTPEFLEPRSTAEKIGGYAETAVEVLAPLPGGKHVAGESLIKSAMRLYESTLKPSTTLPVAKRAEIVKTGLREGISISEQGLQKLETKIDELGEQLDEPIKEAAKAGKKVTLEFLKPFVDEAKNLFKTTADPEFSENAISVIDRKWEALVKKYPNGVPVDVAQEMKKNTYTIIKKAYGKLSTTTVEYQKQVARGLKEGVLENVEVVGEINKRLSRLYEFEKQFDRASNRLRNLNIIGLGTKVLAGVGGKPGAALAVANEIFGGLKDVGAIQMNRLGEYLLKLPTIERESLKKASKVLGGAALNNLVRGIIRAFQGSPEV